MHNTPKEVDKMGHNVTESPKTIKLVSKEFKHSIQFVNEVTEGGHRAAAKER